MRPKKLTIQAFGSYSEKTVIEFPKERNLFLVTGDTGAGKTTIFDAMVFALYGKVSDGNQRRSGTDLQSRFIIPETEPYVELVFTETKGGKELTYTVRRSPAYRKVKKTGKMNKGAETMKTELTLPDGTVRVLKSDDTTIQDEIVGLTKEQFMQTSMIAQGEFREMLSAKSDAKKEIFSRLFNTGIYKSIIEKTAERASEAKKTVGDLWKSSQTLVGQLRLEDAPELSSLARDITSAKDKILTAKLDELQEGLGALCEKQAQDFDRAVKERAAADEVRKKRQAAKNEADALVASFRQLEEAEKILAEGEKRRDETAKMEMLAAHIEAAHDIKRQCKLLDETEKDAGDTEKRLHEEQAQLPDLVKAANERKKAADEAEKEKARAAENGAKIKERVFAALELFKKTADTEAEERKKRAAVESAKRSEASAKKNLADFEAQEKSWRHEADTLQAAEKNLEAWKHDQENLSDANAHCKKAAEARAAYIKAQGSCQTARDAYETAQKEYDAAAMRHKAMQDAFFAAQAGIFAKELEDDMPCPVCGSLSHPSPAKLTAKHQGITKETVDALGKTAATLDTKRRKASDEAGTLSAALEAKKTEYKNVQVALRGAMEKLRMTLPETMKLRDAETLIRAEGEAQEKRGAAIEKDVLRFRELSEKIAHAESDRERLKQAEEDAVQKAADAQSSYDKARAVLDTLRSAPKDYASETAARAALDAAEAENEKRDDAARRAQREKEKADAAKHQACTLIRKYEEELPKKRKKADERRLEYRKLCEEKDLSELEWQEIVEKHTLEKAKSLRDAVERYRETMTKAQAQKETAARAVDGREKPNTEALEQAAAAAEASWAAAQKRLDALQAIVHGNRRIFEELRTGMAERAKAEHDWAILDGLYRRLSGNIGGSHMDIETFVLRYYLASILHAANRRFFDMSNGQFELRMVDVEDAGKGRSNNGLDLIVYSHVNLSSLPVGTLSGGESFMAALSLALGMADMIQAETAAIRLDVMFIDEGFGSLSDNARNEAVKVLQRMAGSDRLIGIISHVTELKQTIEHQLVVTKDNKGSHAKWIVN